jgi:DNA-binding MarR family transcriptional regulator
MTTPLPSGPGFSGQDLGMAAAATRALFDSLLARAGTDFPAWVALRRLAQPGPAPTLDALRRDLAGLLTADLTSVTLLIDRLAARGWTVLDGSAVTLSPDGVAFHRRLVGEIGELTGELYRGIEPADLDAAKRVLGVVTQRANARLAT